MLWNDNFIYNLTLPAVTLYTASTVPDYQWRNRNKLCIDQSHVKCMYVVSACSADELIPAEGCVFHGRGGGDQLGEDRHRRCLFLWFRMSPKFIHLPSRVPRSKFPRRTFWRLGSKCTCRVQLIFVPQGFWFGDKKGKSPKHLCRVDKLHRWYFKIILLILLFSMIISVKILFLFSWVSKTKLIFDERK